MNSRFPQRILMTADAVGGVWSYAMELCRAFEPFNVNVTLATMGPPASPAQRSEALSHANIDHVHGNYKLEWMDSPWSDVDAAGQWLMELEQQFSPDLIHLNGYSHASLPWRAPNVIVAHSCVFSWWNAVKRCSPPNEWDRYWKAVRSGLLHADMVVAPSQAMLDALQEHYGQIESTRVIANGRELEPRSSANKENLILTAGRVWDEAKNISSLTKIAPNLEWPVYVAGECNSPTKDQHDSSNSPPSKAVGCEPRAHYLGHLSPRELTDWFYRAAIYALPARYEPFGLSALEAASAGCALVLGDIPSLREIWRDAAIFVSPEDSNELRQALDQLIAHAELRNQLSRKARDRAANFTPALMAANYLDVYQSLLDSRSAKLSSKEYLCAS
jgi:glycogen(starch) synthase